MLDGMNLNSPKELIKPCESLREREPRVPKDFRAIFFRNDERRFLNPRILQNQRVPSWELTYPIKNHF